MKPKFRKLSINLDNININNSNSTINHCDQSLFPSNISTSFEMNNNDNSLVICDHNQSIESKLSMMIDCSNNDDHQQQRPTHHLAYHHDDIQPLSSYFKHQQQHHHPTHHHRCKSLFTMIAKLSFILLFMFNHHHHQCNCLTLTLLNDNNNSHNNNNNNDNNPIITDNKLKTIRFIRSYSEEFISSSEERERGLQFFGGISSSSSALNGGNSQLSSSSSSLTLTSSSLTSSSQHQQSTQKRISPYFDTETISTNVTISEGSSFVHLPCRVKQLGDRTLSWIRRQDFQILTVGTFTYTSDQRFQAIHRENSDDWSLQISYPKKKDAGIYECQISTMPKMSLFIQLNVVVSRAKILEGPTLYLSSGSTLNLTCSVKDTPEPPDYIFWYYNGQVINYGSPRGIKVHTEKSLETISKLLILNAQTNDSGNYSCTPSNAESAHVAVHVQNNANVAASIQHGKRSASREFNNNRNNGYGTMAASNRYEQSIFVFMIAICTMILMMALI